MKKITLLLIFTFLFIQNSFAQGDSVANAEQFCYGGSELVFPNVTGEPNNTGVGCLGSIPNAAYYYLTIDQAGDLIFDLSQEDSTGAGIDVDFIAWGPFPSVAAADTAITLDYCNPSSCPSNTNDPNFYPYAPDHIVDCSYSALPTETLTIDNAQSGEIYIVLITNFSDLPGSISLQQTGGMGTTSCGDLPVCGSSFYDSGGVSGSYSNNQNETTIIYPYAVGGTVTTTFTMFDVAPGDSLAIYDGPDTSAPLLGTYTGITNPGSFTSTHATGTLSFVFTSDLAIVSNGWAADIVCNSPPTTSSCGNTYTDSGGTSGNYSANENQTSTFYPNTAGDPVTVTFTSFNIEDGWDYLYVYDGPDTSSPTLGAFTGLTVPGPFTSTHATGALTFVFTSDGSTNYTGWEASITCPISCGDTYTDSNAVSGGNYDNNENITTTINPITAGDLVTVTFTSFNTEPTHDVLNIYDGPDDSYPHLGEYSGTTIPGPFTSSHLSGALTFVFTSDNTVNKAGWEADITCGNTCEKAWNGSVSTDWFESNNWTPSGVPTNQDCVIIPDVTTTNNNSPIVVASATSVGLGKSLLVETNGYLELLPDAGLIITDDITVDGKFILRSTSNLIQITNTGITNNGNIQMQREVNGLAALDYVYWSSPVDNFAVNAVSPGSYHRYKWLPTTAATYGNWVGASEIMEPAKGYIIRGIFGTSPEGVPATNTVEFIGVPRNGMIQIPITHGGYAGPNYPGASNIDATELDDNWNLIGNPYPSSISADLFIQENAGVLSDSPMPNTSGVIGTIYLWRHLSAPSAIDDPFYGDYVYNYSGNDYIGYNGTGSNPVGFNGNIAAGQAFFVLMDHNASSPSMVTFNNAMRYDNTIPAIPSPFDNNQFYKTSQISNTQQSIAALEKHRIWLNLIAPNNSTNSILVGYIENATDGIDKVFDGYDMGKTSTRFYTLVEGEEMAIQGKSLPFEDTDTVPLGVVIPQEGNYTIAINTLDGLFENETQNIYIEDTYTEVIHSLREAPFVFNIGAGIYNDRFILRYTNEALNVEEFNLESGLEIFVPKNTSIQVRSKGLINSVSVYDILGRTLEEHKNINATDFSINNPNYSEGTYIIKVILVNGAQKTQKVVLKR